MSSHPQPGVAEMLVGYRKDSRTEYQTGTYGGTQSDGTTTANAGHAGTA